MVNLPAICENCGQVFPSVFGHRGIGNIKHSQYRCFFLLKRGDTLIRTLNLNRQTTAILENAYNTGYEKQVNVI